MNAPLADDKELTGYANRLSVGPSETIQFMISTSESEYDAEIVRMIHADESPHSPGLTEQPVASIAARLAGRRQQTYPGSFLIVDDPQPFELASFTLSAWIAPTVP